jgi:hypothetical protein
MEKELLSEKLKKKKTQSTFYLTEEAEEAFTELFIYRLRKDRKIDKSKIICDAILALYEKECCSTNQTEKFHE